MKKQLGAVVILILVAAGGLTWFILNHYTEREASLPAWSENDLGTNRPKETPEPTLQPITASNIVRLAIGGFGPSDEQAGPLGDLLTVELTAAKGLELVDRAALKAILREQELSLAGLVRAKDAVRIGNLVRADWFLLGSTHSIGSSNIIVARIVDVRTGIMRDIDVVEAGSDLAKTAARLASFVRQYRQAATTVTPHVFLAVGGFADVGVNSRQGAFPGQLRGYLLSAYQQSSLTLLERESVSALLQEVELDLAGVTENSGTNPPPPLRSAFWLVDGYFQSFETSGFEVELRLQVKRAFGETKRFTLRGAPGDLPPRVKEAIDQTLAKQGAEARGPTRRDEIEKQMQMGKDLLTAAWGSLMGGLNMGNESDYPRRRYNVQEAQHAFETVLLLEHDNREAKFYLGSCLSDWTIGHEIEALSYLREVAAAKGKDQFAEFARWMIETIEYRNSMGRWSEGQRGAAIAEPPEAEKLLAEVLRKVEDQWKVKHTWTGVSLYEFVNAFGTNAAKAATSLIPLWPKVKIQFPELAPHTLAAIVSCQVDTNSPLVAEFRKSLADYAQQPEKVFRCESYFTDIAHIDYDWAVSNKLHELAVDIIKAKHEASLRAAEVTFEREDGVKLAFAFVAMERWPEALAAFDEVGEPPVRMSSEGPWGSPFKPFVPAKAVAACRQKLALPPIENPACFSFGSPCACLHTPSTFAATDDAVWLAIGGKLIRVGLDLRTNLQANLPVDDFVPLTALCIGPDHIWVGTGGAGLIDYDKASSKCRLIAEKDGLLLNHVACLWYRDHTLWIGFGRTDSDVVGNLGGLGKLDTTTGRLSSFSQPLSARPVARMTWDWAKSADASNSPPSHAVVALAGGKAEDVWMLVQEYGLRRYCPADNSWGPAPTPPDTGALAIASDGERLVVGLSIEQVKMTLVVRPVPGADTNSVVRTNVLMTPTALERLKADKNSRYSGGAMAGNSDYWLGTAAAYDLREGHWQDLLPTTPLTRPVTRIALDGNDIWAAGWGYVAVVDSARKAVRKISYVPAAEINRLQIAGGYLWAQFDKHLYRVPLSETR